MRACMADAVLAQRSVNRGRVRVKLAGADSCLVRDMSDEAAVGRDTPPGESRWVHRRVAIGLARRVVEERRCIRLELLSWVVVGFPSASSGRCEQSPWRAVARTMKTGGDTGYAGRSPFEELWLGVPAIAMDRAGSAEGALSGCTMATVRIQQSSCRRVLKLPSVLFGIGHETVAEKRLGQPPVTSRMASAELSPLLTAGRIAAPIPRAVTSFAQAGRHERRTPMNRQSLSRESATTPSGGAARDSGGPQEARTERPRAVG